ncbi:hypothetical protein BCR44DRAFT_1487705 [Catenaria anguillulae PL171]|uniref:TMC domain-containing protein n=1 Tax=Catenaria anguillulae PL171 TaxID=765915 RepID=A0A1Y2HAC6_9FUNG|nr:hypothetical protein BCR44DRAFT_1487705 [Catenaria anguillulae PL171]
MDQGHSAEHGDPDPPAVFMPILGGETGGQPPIMVMPSPVPGNEPIAMMQMPVHAARMSSGSLLATVEIVNDQRKALTSLPTPDHHVVGVMRTASSTNGDDQADLPKPVTLDSRGSSVQGSVTSLRSQQATKLGSGPMVSVLDDDDENVIVSTTPTPLVAADSPFVRSASAVPPRSTSKNSSGPTQSPDSTRGRSVTSIGPGAASTRASVRTDARVQRLSPQTTEIEVSVLDEESDDDQIVVGAGQPVVPLPILQEISSSDPKIDDSAKNVQHQIVIEPPGLTVSASKDSRSQRSASNASMTSSNRSDANIRLESSLSHVSGGDPESSATAGLGVCNASGGGARRPLPVQGGLTPDGGGATDAFHRGRSGSVASKISAYNMKFRSEQGPPSRNRSNTIKSNKGKAPNLSPEAVAAAEAALLATTDPQRVRVLSKAVNADRPDVQGADDESGAGGRNTDTYREKLKDQYEGKGNTVRSTTTLSKADHYKSIKSLRSLKSAKATSVNSNEADEDQDEPLWTRSFKRNMSKIVARRRDGFLSLFSGTLKLIEGRFGTGVGSYFRLAKAILIMNFLLATLWVSVVLAEAIISMGDPYYNMTQPAGMPWGRFINTKLSSTFADNVQKFFNGDGWAEYSPIFYSGLLPSALRGTYRMDLAYIFTIFSSIIISFVMILRRMKSEYVNTAGLASQDDVYPFAIIAFSTWSHAVDKEEMIQNQVFAISTLFKMAISQSEVKARITQMEGRSLAKLVLIRIVTNLISFGLLALAGLFIYDSVTLCTSTVNTFFFNVSDVLSQNLSPNAVRCLTPTQTTPFPPYVVSISNAVLPSLFAMIAKFEQYSDPQWETRATLARSYMIKIASVYLMLFSMYPKVNDPNVMCWEHEIAMRFYSLLWLDVGITSVSTVFSAMLTKKIWGAFEFDITSNILELVYRQAIIWIGSTYAPAMTVFSIATTTIIFYVKRYTVVSFAQPPRRIFNTYSQVIWFLMFMLLTLVLTAAPILFAVAILTPSSRCGPYRQIAENTISFAKGEGAFTVIPKSIALMRDEAGKGVLNLLGSIMVIGPILAAFAVWVYFLLAVARRRNLRLLELEKEIKEEREDKKALIRFYGVKT